MKNKKFLVVAAGICLAIMLVSLPFMAACAEEAPAPTPTPAPTPAPTPVEPEEKPLPPIEIKIHGIGVNRPPSDVWYTIPAELFEVATDGRAEVTIYASNAICERKESYECIINGVADATWLFVPLIPGVLPLSEIVHLPGLFPNQATSNVVMSELWEKYPQFEEQFNPDVVVLSTQVHMRADIHSSMPIRNLDDLEGKVIASQSTAGARALELLGAAPTVMSTGDMYTSGERGVVDGCFNAWGGFSTFSLYDVFHYHTLVGLSPGISHWIMFRPTWDKLTEAEQARLKAMTHEFSHSMNIGNVRETEMVWSEHVNAAEGHEFIAWSEADMAQMRETFRPIWDEWVEDMEAEGYPGAEILEEAISLISNYSKL